MTTRGPARNSIWSSHASAVSGQPWLETLGRAPEHRLLFAVLEDAVYPIDAPPLRDRPEDIEPLVRHVAQRFAARMQRRIEVIPMETLDALRRYASPASAQRSSRRGVMGVDAGARRARRARPGCDGTTNRRE